MKTSAFLISFLSAFVILCANFAQAMDEGCGRWQRHPHGNYCEGPGHGRYGERQSVRTAEEARRVLSEYYSSHEDVKIGGIREKRWFFKADIRDKNGTLLDRVIVDKRSGRIRSIY